MDKETLLIQLIKQQQEQMKEMQTMMSRVLQKSESNEQDLNNSALFGENLSCTATSRLMADLGARLSEFSYAPQYGQSFSKWYDRHSAVFTVDGKELDDGAKVRLLLEKLDSDTYDRYKRHIMPKTVLDIDFESTVDKLKSLFDDKVPIFTKRFQTLQLEIGDNEDFQHFVGRVNEQCEIAKVHELDGNGFKVLMCLYGLKAKKFQDVRSKLLAWLDEECRKKPASSEDVTAKPSISLDDLYAKYDKVTSYIRNEPGSSKDREVCISQVGSCKPVQKQVQSSCWNCGKVGHRAQTCVRPKSKCSKCSRIGHRLEFCELAGRFTTKVRPDQKAQKLVKNVVVCSAVGAGRNSVPEYRTVQINGHDVEFEIDTGAEVTLLDVATWKQMGSPKLMESDVRAKGANNREIAIEGMLNCEVLIGTTTFKDRAYVAHSSSLMGRKWIEKHDGMHYHMKMMAVCNDVKQLSMEEISMADDLKQAFGTVFSEELGRCSKEKAKLVLKVNAKPAFRPKRKVPYAAVKTVEDELGRLVSIGVLEPVTHSLWAAPIVCVKKANGNTRVCADFSTGLNDALEEHVYPLPIPDDIFASLNGGEIFSTIDFADAYHQIELEEESSKMVVINTHMGLFRYKRLPFGVKTAPAIFQTVMNKMCSGLKGVACYMDDVIVKGKDESEHRENMFALFERIQEYGFHLKIEKCSFMKSEIPFLGFLVNRHGRRPDPSKTAKILGMKEPTNESQLRSFLGMVTHYSSFIPCLKALRGPLDKLLVKGVRWKWSECEKQAFLKLKNVLGSDLNLTHYDPQQAIVVAADACDYGIGGVISHRFADGTEKPIHHVARSLNSAERNYSQIEKEALALIYAVTQFHKYLYGRKFLLLTDHKPLLAIFGSKKGVPAHSANRLMRWATTLIGYDFDIEYVNTTKFGQADALSRMIQDQQKPDEEVVIAAVEAEVTNVLVKNIRNLPVTYENIRRSTEKDKRLKQVLKFVRRSSWPTNISPDLKQFFNRKELLTEVQGCLMFEDRIVIPDELKDAVLKEIHVGHPGIVRMKNRARGLVYWPGLDEDCTDVVNRCRNCQEAEKAPVKVPLQSWPTPDVVWERIHIDFAGPVDGLYYLVVVDAKSKWPEVIAMKHITARNTVSALLSLFIRFGMPEVIVSDNGTQFVSQEFADMCQMYGICHKRIAPYHPQSNGQAERFVDTLKRGFKKLKGEEKVPESMLNTVLLAYRTTPCPSLDNRTPAEVFLGRKIRTRLSLLLPQLSKDYIEKDNAKLLMENQFNKKHGTKKRSFKLGDDVLVKSHRNLNWIWKSATVVSRIGKVMYKVHLDGKDVIKHANQMRAVDLAEEQSNPDKNQFEYWFEVLSDSLVEDADVVSGSSVIDSNMPCSTSMSDVVPSTPRRSPSLLNGYFSANGPDSGATSNGSTTPVAVNTSPVPVAVNTSPVAVVQSPSVAVPRRSTRQKCAVNRYSPS